MKSILTIMALLVTANAAQANTVAGVPAFIVECPGKLLVQADQDGSVLINSKEAETKAINDRRFEAKGTDVTLKIVVADDDSVAVTSTGKVSKGVCESVED
ncbi:hypothetical protein [Pseudomonas sp. PB3P13]